MHNELIERARTDLLHFIVYMNPSYKVAKHHRLICDKAMEVLNSQNRRLIVSLPPRHGKSTILSEYLPAFLFGYKQSKEEVIATSYSASLATTFGKKVRRIMSSPEYKALFPNVHILGEGDAGGYFEMANKSQYVAVGRGGSITGRGASFFLIDDLIKDSQEAKSRVILDGCKEWWATTAYTRLLPGGNVIIVMTRWSQDDLPGYLLSKEPERWEVLNIPAICEEPETDPLGRAEGEALWPEWYDTDYLEPIRAQNAYQFSALYQGNPVAKTGNVFDVSQIRIADALPERFDVRLMAWDTASTTGDQSCFTAGVLIGIRDDRAYLLDCVMRKVKFPELVHLVKTQSALHGIDYLLIEHASSGIQLLQLLETDKSLNCKLEPISAAASKQSKVEALLYAFEHNQLMFGTELSELAEQIKAFPYGQNDDGVIALAHAIAWWQSKTRNGQIRLNPVAKTKLLTSANTFFAKRNPLIYGDVRQQFTNSNTRRNAKIK